MPTSDNPRKREITGLVTSVRSTFLDLRCRKSTRVGQSCVRFLPNLPPRRDLAVLTLEDHPVKFSPSVYVRMGVCSTSLTRALPVSGRSGSPRRNWRSAELIAIYISSSSVFVILCRSLQNSSQVPPPLSFLR